MHDMEIPKPGKLFIFWDFDAQWGAVRSRAPGGAKSWGPLDFENTERLLEIHAQAGIPACFAVVGAVALIGERPRHDPALVRRISSMGHEIASHSMYHEWLPGMGYTKLIDSLRDSKNALEQAAGCPVLSFVPPFNQPVDHLPAGSISLSERMQAGKDRIDLRRLCQALGETGYRFCRVSYSPFFERFLRQLGLNRRSHPSFPEEINCITCLRLNTRAGFQRDALTLLDRCAQQGGLAVVYGHPHSLHSGNAQDELSLLSFLEKANSLIASGRLQAALPGQLVKDGRREPDKLGSWEKR